ncbi:MAG: hypothetical protein PHZ11_08285 [Desulfitobacteriaceae bacterium]|nr:hypothetical protein [Desulfitobacteriaceae bacterium]MDD4346864.1 hypothetical protein [Desulfitobacteriaceae bacterium]MDD4402367.1 hypothetical protein [Desulfitobacteriaceae bacterium]
MKLDKPLVAALFGILSTFPYELSSRILLLFGIGKYSEYQLSSLVITLDRPTAILGFFISSILGSTSALLFYYILGRVRSDYLIIKGIAVGLISFLFLETVFSAVIEGPGLIPFRPISDHYLHLFGAAVFGLTLGLLFKSYLYKEAD